MNGYMNKKMPPYRQIQGRVVCHNPYHGWIPFICSGDPQLQTTLSSRWLNTPVGVLQEFLQHNNDGNSIINYPPDIENRLMRGMDIPLRPALEVPRSAYVAILDKVRNTILNWRALIRNSASASKSLDLRRSHKDLRRENRFTYQSPTGAYGWKRMAFSVTA